MKAKLTVADKVAAVAYKKFRVDELALAATMGWESEGFPHTLLEFLESVEENHAGQEAFGVFTLAFGLGRLVGRKEGEEK